MPDAEKPKAKRYLTVARCPTHGWMAVSIDDDGGGVRVTPGKCCGRWDTVKRWSLSAREWRELAEACEHAAEAVEE